MLIADEVRTKDIPTALVRDRVLLGNHLCSNSVPVQALESVLVDNGEQQVAVSCISPRRRHGECEVCQSGCSGCL